MMDIQSVGIRCTFLALDGMHNMCIQGNKSLASYIADYYQPILKNIKEDDGKYWIEL